jgi:hypothetical protein
MMMFAETAALSQLSLGAFVLVIVIICAGFALMRGAFRLIINTIILGVSITAGYWVWVMTPGWNDKIMANPPSWSAFILPITASLITFIILRKIIRFILRPFGNVGGAPSSFFGKIFSLSFSLVPSILLCITGATALRHIGSLDQIRNPAASNTSVLLKKTIDQYIPPAWLQKLDPLTDPSRITLASLVSLASKNHVPRAIPIEEEDHLRNTVLSDPELQKLIREQRYGDLLRDPKLNKALEDPRIQKALQQLQLAH